MSLRAFHLFFIFLVILGADLFGIWAFWAYAQGHDPLNLALGCVAVLGGLGLVVYAIRLIRAFDRSGIH